MPVSRAESASLKKTRAWGGYETPPSLVVTTLFTPSIWSDENRLGEFIGASGNTSPTHKTELQVLLAGSLARLLPLQLLEIRLQSLHGIALSGVRPLLKYYYDHI